MRCTAKDCQNDASKAFVVFDGARNKERHLARCEGHAEFKPTTRVLSSGALCPCCTLGFVAQWAHVDNGRCYRCNGKGHW